MKILNFGSCNVDYVYSLDHIVRVGETETTERMEIFPGGKGLNQSIAVARAGAEIYHAGCVGNDGEMLTELLGASGVNVSFMRRVDAKNGHAIIQVSAKGDNSIFLYPGSNEMVTKDYIDSVLESFEGGDILLLQNEISNVDYIIEKAHSKRMRIVFNPSPINEKIAKIDLNMLSYLVLNEVEAKEITGKESPDEVLVYFRAKYPFLKIMLTLGDKGCVYMDSEREIWQGAFKVDVVDTTAAGDTFTGYFVAGVACGDEYSEVLKIASAASAISVSRNGAAPSIPMRDEVLERFSSLKINDSDGKNELLRSQIEGYIEMNMKNASLEELAGILGYSVVYTGNLAKKLTGFSFSKLLQNKRCTTAADLLASTDLSIKEIINMIGYENESFFRQMFKEKYGKSPLEFRKKGIK